jgi:hypothetical protein
MAHLADLGLIVRIVHGSVRPFAARPALRKWAFRTVLKTIAENPLGSSIAWDLRSRLTRPKPDG